METFSSGRIFVDLIHRANYVRILGRLLSSHGTSDRGHWYDKANLITLRTVTLMIFLWTLVIIFNLFGVIASRRMANLGYVLWITAMTPS